jgi:hypothetical protein
VTDAATARDDAWYVYAVVPAEAEAPTMGGVLPGCTVEVLPFRPVAILASRVARSLFDSTGPANRTADAGWMAERLAAHHAVVAAAGLCLPMTFGVLFADLGLLHAWLAPRSACLRDALRRAADQTEWMLTVEEDRAALTEWIDGHDPALRRLTRAMRLAGEAGAEVLVRRLEQDRQTARLRCLQQAQVAVTRWANETSTDLLAEPTRNGLPAWTVLLPKAHPNACDQSMPALARQLPAELPIGLPTGLSLSVSGPWPAYAQARAALAEGARSAELPAGLCA